MHPWFTVQLYPAFERIEPPPPTPEPKTQPSSFTGDGGSAMLTLDSVGIEAGTLFNLPLFTTAERDNSTPIPGSIIFNSDTSRLEYYDGSRWVIL